MFFLILIIKTRQAINNNISFQITDCNREVEQMRKNAFVFMAEGFEEMELTITTDILRRAEIEIKTVGLKQGTEPVNGSRGIKMIPDLSFDDADFLSADAVILPGGLDGTMNLAADKRVLDVIDKANRQGRLVAAICAAPLVLLKANILAGKNVTCHPAAKGELQGVNYKTDRVVIDNNIITSQAAGTTFEFAYAIIEKLLDKNATIETDKGVLYYKS